jgi:predicted dithiol-disulfide oxidoreductase (DUF899 family)
VKGIRFPNESPEYRAARDALAAAEADLIRQIEHVATQRRSLPAGGLLAEDYVFTENPADVTEEGHASEVRLSELFGSHDTLLLYSFMYGPDMPRPCPMCTSLLDGLDGSAPDIHERAAFAVVAKSPISRIRAYARERRWRNLRLISSAGNSYNRDYHGESASGEQDSVMNVFVRDGEQIRHFYATERSVVEPGWDDRHVDLLWPLWNVLDLTAEGRGSDWRPAYTPKAQLPGERA